ncbi:MAG: DbpA RNA binding domain-containing protein [Longimicrobiales bacterium]
MSPDFGSLALSAKLVERAAAIGFDGPTRIQKAAIPVLRRGGNAVVRASSGSGVTAAVLLALLDRLTEGEPVDRGETESAGPTAMAPVGPATVPPDRSPTIASNTADASAIRPRALIVAVTDERASDIARTGALLGEGGDVRVGAMAAAWSAPGKADILVAASAAVMQAIRESLLKLDGVEALVIDRADALVEIETAETLAAVAAAVPAGAQRIVLAGTITKPVERFLESHARRAMMIPAQPADPALVTPPAAAGSLSYIVVPATEKPAALARLLRRPREEAPLIVTRSTARASAVTAELALRGFGAADARVAGREAGEGARIAYDVPSDATLLAALDLEHGIVMVEPAELPHLRQTAAEAGITLTAVGGTRAVRGTVAGYRDTIRRAIEEQDLDAQLSLLEPLFDEYSAAEVAGALSALLRRRRTDAGAMPEPVKDAPPAFVRLFVSLGQRDNMRPADLLGAITGETSIAGKQVGRIEIRDTFSIVEVAASEADRIIRALNGTTLRGRSLRVDYDRRSGTTPRDRPARMARQPHR